MLALNWTCSFLNQNDCLRHFSLFFKLNTGHKCEIIIIFLILKICQLHAKIFRSLCLLFLVSFVEKFLFLKRTRKENGRKKIEPWKFKNPQQNCKKKSNLDTTFPSELLYGRVAQSAWISEKRLTTHKIKKKFSSFYF